MDGWVECQAGGAEYDGNMKMTLGASLEMDHEAPFPANGERNRLAGRVNDLSVSSYLWMDDDCAALASVRKVRAHVQ
jgi:hypothetical protein